MKLLANLISLTTVTWDFEDFAQEPLSKCFEVLS